MFLTCEIARMNILAMEFKMYIKYILFPKQATMISSGIMWMDVKSA